MGIKTMVWPRYSPDLTPLDFSLWDNINKRMDASAPKGKEGVSVFKKRLRPTALRTPRSVVHKMVTHIRKRAQDIYDADGHDIARD